MSTCFQQRLTAVFPQTVGACTDAVGASSPEHGDRPANRRKSPYMSNDELTRYER
jgi:hypothetical protein